MKENNQEYYNTIMTKKLAERIISLRDESNTSWKEISGIIQKEFGNDFALENNVITSMYLEYAARDYIWKKKNKKE